MPALPAAPALVPARGAPLTHRDRDDPAQNGAPKPFFSSLLEGVGFVLVQEEPERPEPFKVIRVAREQPGLLTDGDRGDEAIAQRAAAPAAFVEKLGRELGILLEQRDTAPDRRAGELELLEVQRSAEELRPSWNADLNRLMAVQQPEEAILLGGARNQGANQEAGV